MESESERSVPHESERTSVSKCMRSKSLPDGTFSEGFKEFLKSNEALAVAKMTTLLQDMLEKVEERIINEIRGLARTSGFGVTPISMPSKGVSRLSMPGTSMPGTLKEDSTPSSPCNADSPAQQSSPCKQSRSRKNSHRMSHRSSGRQSSVSQVKRQSCVSQDISKKNSGASELYDFWHSARGQSSSSISNVIASWPVTLEALEKANDHDVIRHHRRKKREDDVRSHTIQSICQSAQDTSSQIPSSAHTSNPSSAFGSARPSHDGTRSSNIVHATAFSTHVPSMTHVPSVTSNPASIGKGSMLRPSFNLFSRFMPQRPERVSEEVLPASSSSFTPFHTVSEGKNLQSLREERLNELLASAQDSARRKTDSITELKSSCSPLWLCICGILPWSSNGDAPLYHRVTNRIAIFAFIIGCAVYCIHNLTTLRHDETCEAVLCTKDTLLPILILAIGCCLRFLSMFLMSDVVGRHDAILTYHLSSIEASNIWSMSARCDTIKLLLLWIGIVVLSVYASFDWKVDCAQDVSLLLVLAFTTHIFLAFVHSMLYICRGLYLGIDSFCADIVEFSNCDDACEDWNEMQAIIRRVCITVAHTYMVLLTSSVVAMFLPLLYDNDWEAMLPGALAVLILLWVALYIGKVTSKCDRVPVFINTLDFGQSFDHQRQYVVDYIWNSRAGFYMFDVRITGEMVVKGAYIGFAVVAAVFTRSLSKA